MGPFQTKQVSSLHMHKITLPRPLIDGLIGIMGLIFLLFEVKPTLGITKTIYIFFQAVFDESYSMKNISELV